MYYHLQRNFGEIHVANIILHPHLLLLSHYDKHLHTIFHYHSGIYQQIPNCPYLHLLIIHRIWIFFPCITKNSLINFYFFFRIPAYHYEYSNCQNYSKYDSCQNSIRPHSITLIQIIRWHERKDCSHNRWWYKSHALQRHITDLPQYPPR